MSNSYYYLVAGLPDLVIDGTKKPVSMVAFIEDVAEQITPADAALFSMIRLPYDNENLCALLADKQDATFDARGIYTRDELEEEIKSPDRLPGYMIDFIEAHKEGKDLFAGLARRDQLAWLFFEHALRHPNRFIREWYAFELDLRNVLAGFNARRMHRDGEEYEQFTLANKIVTRAGAADSILRSNAPDFSLSAQIPWVERLIAANEEDLTTYEKDIDTLRWDMLNELTTFAYFSIEAILAFCIKLAIVERWQALDEQAGKEKLDRLIKELKSGFDMPEDFL
jgi:hypothetical protein